MLGFCVQQPTELSYVNVYKVSQKLAALFPDFSETARNLI